MEGYFCIANTAGRKRNDRAALLSAFMLRDKRLTRPRGPQRQDGPTGTMPAKALHASPDGRDRRPRQDPQQARIRSHGRRKPHVDPHDQLRLCGSATL